MGRVLFYDEKLSALEDISCGTCHIQELSFTESKRFSEGISAPTKRNSMHLNDLAWSNADGFSWAMKEDELSSMILLPLTDENEIGANLEDVRIKLENTTYYPVLFTRAFGDSNISEERIVDTLVHFISSMTTFNSKFDNQLKNDFSGFSESESLGMEIFSQNCATCHSQGAHSFFGEEIFVEGNILEILPFFFNNGLETKPDDIGAGEWLPGFDHLFKVPTLRNIELTGPYMHDGQFTTLEEVLNHYSEDVVDNEWSGFFIPSGGFQFSQGEKTALVDFMKTFTDESFLTEVRWSDPFAEIVFNENQLSIKSISLHPNPTSGSATIAFKNEKKEVVAISIYSQDGRLLNHEKITSDSYFIEKADYPEGIYFVNLLMGSKKATQKLIIQ
ncbi:MAG: cytochrome c peroxidase [Saprospiraceae bacterium]